jgi:hypothetical protein
MSNSNIIITNDLNCTTIKIPDNDTDHQKFNKMGFNNTEESERTNRFIIPDKYLCEYEMRYNKDGGFMGSSSTYQCWKLINKKTKNLVVTISEFRDGDYPPYDTIKWH